MTRAEALKRAADRLRYEARGLEQAQVDCRAGRSLPWKDDTHALRISRCEGARDAALAALVDAAMMEDDL